MPVDRPGFLLVHSPLVGPSTWAPLATELERRGERAVVVRLTPLIDVDPPYAMTHAAEAAAQAAAAGLERVVLVGHSATGARLPMTGQALAESGIELAAYVFVDAVLPAANRTPRDVLPAEFLELVDRLATDGLLPPWPTWWPPEVLVEAVPDATARSTIEADCPPIPLDLYDEPVPVSDAWPDAPCAYLSFTYDAEAAEAERRGWPVARVAGGHLHAVVAPVAVADAVLALTAQVASAPDGTTNIRR